MIYLIFVLQIFLYAMYQLTFCSFCFVVVLAGYDTQKYKNVHFWTSRWSEKRHYYCFGCENGFPTPATLKKPIMKKHVSICQLTSGSLDPMQSQAAVKESTSSPSISSVSNPMSGQKAKVSHCSSRPLSILHHNMPTPQQLNANQSTSIEQHKEVLLNLPVKDTDDDHDDPSIETSGSSPLQTISHQRVKLLNDEGSSSNSSST